ncbi:MAG TPA: hypothetical protein PK450_05310 [Paracoccaceae bacterium]|nr:hypothetical protein [Paracoccaceae bacterium]
MPELVRMYIRHVAIGFLLACIFTAALLWLNVGNLWHLVQATDVGPLAVVMLVIFNAIVFSGVQFGIAVMGMAEEDGKGGGTRAPVCDGVPVVVAAESGGNRSNRAGVNFPRA